MPLRSKLLVILFGVFFLYAGVHYAIQQFLVYPYFNRVEVLEARAAAQRCVTAIEREVRNLASLARNLTAGACVPGLGPEERYRPGVDPSWLTISRSDNSFVYILDEHQDILWGEHCDPNGQVRHVSAGADPHVEGLLSFAQGTADSDRRNDGMAGVLLTQAGPILVASAPLHANVGLVQYAARGATPTGPSDASRQSAVPSVEPRPNRKERAERRLLIVGRHLNEDMVAGLARQTGVYFALHPAKGHELAGHERAVAAHISPDKPFFAEELDPRVLRVYTRLTDIYGLPTLLISADVPRVIFTNVRVVMRFAGLSILAVGLLALLVMQSSLRRLVVEPIAILTEHAIGIGQSSDLSSRLAIDRKDEIGVLASEFNRMLDQLAAARRRLLEQSYTYGKAEMAAGVLHNVRNSLNPILIQIETLREELRSVPIEKIEQARAELAGGDLSSDRRRNLTQFLDLAGPRLSALVQRAGTRLDELSGQAARIEKILLDHDGLIRARPPIEPFELEQVVRDAITLMPDDLRQIAAIEIEHGVGRVGTVEGHRISLLQVFANLLINAAESIKATRSGGEIRVAAKVESSDGRERVHIWFMDNGEGIEADHLNRLFERGFSTKPHGSGLGLHWSHNTVSAMGGRLWAESEGKGMGACFHVLIPKRAMAADQGGTDE